MTLQAEIFEVHDISTFPLIRFRSDKAVPGYAAQWQREMDELLLHGEVFAVLYGSGHNAETHEDRKLRGIWLKQNKTELARLCCGLASVEPDPAQREAMQKMAEGAMRAFGVKQMVEASEPQAQVRLLSALDEAGLTIPASNPARPPVP